jgi:hypothetical protein
MADDESRGWLPNVIGAGALLLAVDTARQLVQSPPEYSLAIVIGYQIAGWTAYIASIIFMVFYAWVSAAAFRRRALTVSAVLAYCGYLIVSVWIWSSEQAGQSFQTRMITSALVTVLLLSFCRAVYERREQFDH